MDCDALCVGRIGYLNVLPIYYPLEQGTLKHPFSFVYGSPAELNELMARGLLEISVVSSIEYARRSGRYVVLPHLSISSRGEVKSVLLFSHVPLADLDGEVVHFTPQSHSSVALLKILLRHAVGVRCSYVVLARPLWQSRLKERPTAYLAIGDEALYWAKRGDFPYVFDLGDLWYRWTGLPFVFAVWICTREFADRHAAKLERSIEIFHEAKAWGLRNLQTVALQAARTTFLTHEELLAYFQCLSYHLERDALEGLRFYFQMLQREGEIAEVPPVRLYEQSSCLVSHDRIAEKHPW